MNPKYKLSVSIITTIFIAALILISSCGKNADNIADTRETADVIEAVEKINEITESTESSAIITTASLSTTTITPLTETTTATPVTVPPTESEPAAAIEVTAAILPEPEATSAPTEPPTTTEVRTTETGRYIDMTAEYNQPKCTPEQIFPGAHPIEKVYVGYDGFMFYGDTIRDYTGENIYASDAVLKAVANVFVSYNDWCKEKGYTFYVMFPPNKNTIYSDFMHESIKKADVTKRDMLIEYLQKNTDVKVIDVKQDLLSLKVENPDRLLYFKLDTHWNAHAGFIAYSKMIDEISKDFPNVVKHERTDYDINYVNSYMKDMPWYLGYYDTYEEAAPVYTLKAGTTAKLVRCDKPKSWSGIFYHAKVDGEGYHDMNSYTSYKNDAISNAPKLYMIRDSFSIALIPFLKDSFSVSSFKWTTDFDKNAISNENPDIVIYEMVERLLP